MTDVRPALEGRLELTWTNKSLRLLAHADGSYEWVPASDYRVSEVRLLDDAANVGEAVAERRAAENLVVRGDALNALRSLAELPEFADELAGRVKLAYLDPPFNTQQSWLHYDDALEHSVWLSMMRDRLLQVRELLSPTGSVWVHCDDAEGARLKVLMDELFSPACFVGTVIWRSTDNSNHDAKQFSVDHNYIHVYARDAAWRTNGLSRTEEQGRHYANPDGDPRGPWFDGNPLGSPNPRENLTYVIESPTGHQIASPPNGWRWSRETLAEKMATGEIRFSEDGTRIIRRTYLADQGLLPPSTLWAENEVTGSNRQAKYELKRLFDLPTAQLFDTPKPERLMSRIIELATVEGDIVLDCFLGSGTTAAVAHKMGRRWVGIENSADTLSRFAIPRLEKVVAGEDSGGVTDHVGWRGGGAFRVLDVAPSMFMEEGGMVYLAEWATNGRLAEACAAQLHFEEDPDPPFAGRRGRMRLAVVDGLVNADAVNLLLKALPETEQLTVCGTAVDPEVRALLREARPGSTARKIPQAILEDYRLARWLPRSVGEPPAPGVQAVVAAPVELEVST